ncbi:hypothetical protein [Bulleidia extructa]
MSAFYGQDDIHFQGILTEKEIHQMIQKGTVNRLQTDVMPLDRTT